MTDFHDNIDIEELKKFFLEEARLLCPAARLETSEREKLHILYSTLKRMTKLMGLLCHCNLEVHYNEVYDVFGFYLVEKDGEKKKKHQMSARLSDYNKFLIQLTKLKDLNTHFYFYYVVHLKALERIMKNDYPDDFQDGQINEIGIKELLSKENGK